ncbi:MAG: CoA-binding protein [Pirellulales bacterium]
MKTCAIVGDVFNPAKWANKSLRAHQMAGFRVFPVHPAGGELNGSPVYASLTDIPERLDRISVYLRPSLVMEALDAIAEKGCDELWLNPGTYTPEVVERAESLGLHAIRGCSIIDVGVSPSSL